MHLAAQWHEREVQKEYFAIAAGRMDRDRDVIDAPIGKHPYQRDKQAIRADHPTSREASTFYEVQGRFGRINLVRSSQKQVARIKYASTLLTSVVRFCVTGCTPVMRK